MSLIKKIEDKIKLALTVAVLSFAASIFIVAVVCFYAFKYVRESQSNVYVLSNNIPLVATRKNVADNRTAEYKGAIQDFHELFFNLPPDDKFIQHQIGRAMYLIDATGIAQYNTLKEKDFYTTLVQTSTNETLVTDSIAIDPETKHWVYFGTEKIDRPSNIVIRSLVTEGYLQDIPRSENNPHGVLLTRWKTIENKDLSNEAKQTF